MTFTISPCTAIDRIIDRGFNPLQFISRAFCDHSYEWAKEFEALAHLNQSLGLAMTAAQAAEFLSEEIEMEFAILVASHTPWICCQNRDWFIQLSEIVFGQIYKVSQLDSEWGFTCDHNYDWSDLSNRGNHSCKINAQDSF